MKRSIYILALSVALSVTWAAHALAQGGAAPADSRKHTDLGKYCTAMEAYIMWRGKPKEVHILDVRTPEEYDFVGHPEMAVNIPSKVNTGKFNAEKKAYDLADNPEFAAEVAKRFGKNDLIIAMCRSGHRAAAAVNVLAKAGFTNVYNMVDSFEGDTVNDPESVYNGKRMKNGWKNYGLPWTNSLNPELVWKK